MPTFDFKCEICGKVGREWRPENPPRFCSDACKNIGMVGSRKNHKWVIDAQGHNLIREAYRRPTGNGEIKNLAKKLGVPRWKVTRYAQHHLWTKRTKKMPEWTESEIKILKSNARHSPEEIQRALKKAGYARTVVGILLKRKRLRMTNQSLDGYSASSLAMCLGEDNHFITQAIKTDELPATRRVQNRTKQQGGNAFWIKPKDARKWILDNVNRIDLTKVDKYWFVDIVSGAGL